MDDKLRNQFLVLEKKREALMQRLEKLNNEQLNQPEAEGKWSLMQVCEHLMLGEKASIDYIEKKLTYPKNIPANTIFTKIRYFVFKAIIASPLKFKAPPIAQQFADYSDFAELRQRWQDNRQALRSTINRIPDNLIRRNIYKHPAAGKLSIYQCLDFHNTHFNHHMYQIERILKKMEG